MGRVIADISMSLDGFVTGPGPGPENGLGTGGDGLHTWAFSTDPVDRAVLTSTTEATGVVVMGRRLFDIIDGPQGWSDEVGYGADLAAAPPLFDSGVSARSLRQTHVQVSSHATHLTYRLD
jgi:dihydrofolate reductase